MKYQIILWKLNAENQRESGFECFCQTQWELIELFDCVTRGVRGHYKARAIDLDSDKVVRESEVSYSR